MKTVIICSPSEDYLLSEARELDSRRTKRYKQISDLDKRIEQELRALSRLPAQSLFVKAV